MELTKAQKLEFYEKGYVHAPGVVSPWLVKRALSKINGSFGSVGVPPEKLSQFHSQSFFPELVKSEAILDLATRSPAFSLAESLAGTGTLNPIDHGQIALRFPSELDPPPAPRPHIDGIHSPHNGVPKGEIYSFTMLLCVFLSDVAEEFAGNFTVWEGSHHLHEAYFKEHDPCELMEGMPKVDLPKPTQLIGKAGDIVLAHYALGHAAAINVRENIRYAIFFRLSRTDHGEHRFDCLRDLWKQFDGVKDILPEAGQE